MLQVMNISLSSIQKHLDISGHHRLKWQTSMMVGVVLHHMNPICTSISKFQNLQLHDYGDHSDAFEWNILASLNYIHNINNKVPGTTT